MSSHEERSPQVSGTGPEPQRQTGKIALDKDTSGGSKEPAAPDFTMASENKATDPSPSQAEDPLNVEEPLQANVVNRVTSIPLIHSAFNLVSSAYNFTKGTHPYVTSVCTVAETVAAVAVGSAVGGAQPILSHLEPQIAKVNEYACKSLDQLEEKLPFLQQPTEKVLTDTRQLVATTVMNAVDTAKDAVASRVAGAVDLTKHVVQDSVELTKSVVSSTVNTALDAATGTKDTVTSKVNAAMGQGREAIQDGVEMTSFMVNSSINTAKAVGNVVASGVDAVLWKSEELVDHYLPVTEEELVQLAASVEGFSVTSVEQQKQQQSYFVRLGSLSNKVRHRAYLHSLNKLQLVKKNTQNTLSYLQLAINLIESVKEGAGQKLQESQEKLYELWLEWTLTQPKGTQVEPRVLAMLRMITLQLQPAYTNLMSSIQGLPSSIQETMQHALSNIQQLQASFSSACSFQDLSTSILSQNQDRVVKLRESLDTLLDYVANAQKCLTFVQRLVLGQGLAGTPQLDASALWVLAQIYSLLVEEKVCSQEAKIRAYRAAIQAARAKPDTGESKFFSFVVVHAMEDVDIACRVKELLESMGVPDGATFCEDFLVPGHCQLTCFQDAINNSAFTLLLLTENFQCRLCTYQMNSALMDSILRLHKYNSVIPFVPKEYPLKKGQIPGVLAGLVPLDENSRVFTKRVKNTFVLSKIKEQRTKWSEIQQIQEAHRKQKQYQEHLQAVQAALAALNIGSQPGFLPPMQLPDLTGLQQFLSSLSAQAALINQPYPGGLFMPGYSAPSPSQPSGLLPGHQNMVPGTGHQPLIIQNARMVQIGDHNQMQVERTQSVSEDSDEETSECN
ncbi:hypothetical protein Y1Q_0000235 [Alligator mississippiensis]|uniref:TIR domain-containing protein n=1 Tax=Alligator mississippiensis TaxID=8496 RepID=A0A151P0X6_ALLMI|nr:hypothetical protein Y1Q_0000235 [Alligator mississippiensis]